MPTFKVQNTGGFLGASTFIVSAVKVFSSPRTISSRCYLNYNTLVQEIFVKCRRAGDQSLPQNVAELASLLMQKLILKSKVTFNLFGVAGQKELVLSSLSGNVQSAWYIFPATTI